MSHRVRAFIPPATVPTPAATSPRHHRRGHGSSRLTLAPAWRSAACPGRRGWFQRRPPVAAAGRCQLPPSGCQLRAAISATQAARTAPAAALAAMACPPSRPADPVALQTRVALRTSRPADPVELQPGGCRARRGSRRPASGHSRPYSRSGRPRQATRPLPVDALAVQLPAPVPAAWPTRCRSPGQAGPTARRRWWPRPPGRSGEHQSRTGVADGHRTHRQQQAPASSRSRFPSPRCAWPAPAEQVIVSITVNISG